jgi:N-methylhydantoinase A
MTARHIRIGIDTGGTFTDVVAFDESTGGLTVTKTPSTPADPAQGFVTGLEKMLALLGTGMDAVASVSHGTTIATNQLLEGDVGRLGFITSEGFEFILEIARQSVPDGYGNSYFWVKPDRIVPPDLVKTVGGRMDHTGVEMRPFDEARAVEVARWFRERGVETLGVCFLHSYANPEHEERMAAVLAREHPRAVVSLSSRVLPEYREYERSMTTLVDAAVKPRVSRYLASIAEQLERVAGGDGDGGGRQRSVPSRQTETPGQHTRAAAGQHTPSAPAGQYTPSAPAGQYTPSAPAGQHTPSAVVGQRTLAADTADTADTGGISGGVPLHVMTSSGGVVTAERVISQPINTVLSGPAAGAVGAAMIAQNAGIDQVLTCDGGGTSTDVAVVVGGEPALTTEGSVGIYPSKIPMVDVVTVGAGGGSVAWVSPEGALKVGPRSAGADPGPLCYAKGGSEVTVTDAHLVLGRIPPHLLGGEVPLDAEAARAGVADLAKRLGLAAEECAAGILEISAWNQANAVRRITVKRGLDVRDFTLVTFGGSGSLLLCPLIEILGVKGVLVPPNPGNVSAFGLLTVDVRSDHVRTAVARHAELDHAAMDKIFDGLARQADSALSAQGFALEQHQLSRTADLRYYGQACEVRVPVGDRRFGPELADAAADAFHEAHHALYGYDFRGDPRQQVEWVNLRVAGIGPIQRPELTELVPAGRADSGSGVRRPGVSVCRDGAPALPSRGSPGGEAVTGNRPVVFGRSSASVPTPLYWRPQLAPGVVVAGPAVIEEYGATVPVHPGFAARVDRFGNLLVAAEGAPS